MIGSSIRQVRAVVSSDAVTRSLPSGEKESAEIEEVWPLNCAMTSPLATSQTRTVSSAEEVAIRCSSGENVAIRNALLVDILNDRNSLPLSASQMRAKLSPAARIRLPSRSNATCHTVDV